MKKIILNKELSSQCWIPHLNLKNKKKNIETNSWFSQSVSNYNNTKLINTSSINNLNKKEELYKSIKINIQPTESQQLILKEWYKLYRYYYNQTVKYINTNNFIVKEIKEPIEIKTTKKIKIKVLKSNKCKDIIIKHNEKDLYNILKKIKKEEKKERIYNKFDKSFIGLRKIIKDKTNKEITKIIEKYKMPSHLIDNAIKDVTKALKSGYENIKKGNIKFFRLRYKKKKKNKETMVLEGASFSKKLNTFSPKSLGDNIKSDIPIQSIKKDSKLCHNKKLNTYVIYTPIKENKKENKKDKKSIISLDPGLRTFLTGYSNNKIEEIGTNGIQFLDKKIKKLNKIKNKKGLIKRYYKRIDKIKNKIIDLHWKSIIYLCKNYNTIMIGKLSTKSIISKKNSLPKFLKNIASYMSHFNFRQRLKYKCEQYNCNYLEVDESYTSKTCGQCGKENNNLGKKKLFKCKNCNLKIDRDVNGARNIFLKNIEIYL